MFIRRGWIHRFNISLPIREGFMPCIQSILNSILHL
ncbi:hypothetical protein [Pseudomonas phage ANB1]|nr:hypothetical protein [Pseudomonas phage ANB1]